MAAKSYADRDLLDKLGVRDGMRILLAGDVPKVLRKRLSDRTDVEVVEEAGDDPVNVVLLSPEDASRARMELDELRRAIAPDGAIWVLTPKRGEPGYVRQEALIPQGKAVGLVDNKVCSIDEKTSAMRFVIPLAYRDRQTGVETG